MGRLSKIGINHLRIDPIVLVSNDKIKTVPNNTITIKRKRNEEDEIKLDRAQLLVAKIESLNETNRINFEI